MRALLAKAAALALSLALAVPVAFLLGPSPTSDEIDSGTVRLRRLLALAAAVALVAAVAAFPVGRRQLARLWPAPLVGLLWTGATLFLGYLAVAAASTLVSGEGALWIVLVPLALGPWAAVLGAAGSCGRRVPERPNRVFAAAVLCGTLAVVALAAWATIGLSTVELYVVLVLVGALVATAAGAIAAALRAAPRAT